MADVIPDESAAAQVAYQAWQQARGVPAGDAGDYGWSVLGPVPRQRWQVALEAAEPLILAAAGKVVTEGKCRQIMQQIIESEKSRLLEEVVRSAGERLEQATDLARLAARVSERARICNGAEGLKFTLFRPGNGPAQGSALDVVPLAELLDLIGGEE